MHWQFGEMEFGEMKRNTSNWSNFCMLLRRAGLTASAGLSCHTIVSVIIITDPVCALVFVLLFVIHRPMGYQMVTDEAKPVNWVASRQWRNKTIRGPPSLS